MTEFHPSHVRQSEIRSSLFAQMNKMSGQYAIAVRYMQSVLAHYGMQLDFYFNAHDRIQFRVAVHEDGKFFCLSETNSNNSADTLTPEAAIQEMPAAMSTLMLMKPEVFESLFKNFSREELVAQAVILLEGFAEQHDLLLRDIQMEQNHSMRTSSIRSLHSVRRQLKAMGFKKLPPLNLRACVSIQVEEADQAKKSSTHKMLVIA